ncbi:pentapeptide repeat-containing protein [Nonomuraea wenchangensis]
MKPISVVVAAVVVALVVGVVWVLGPGARWVLEHVDGVAIGGRTGLSGKDLAAAVDAVRGRVLAVATGLAALVAVYYTARNADTARRTFQLGERGHVTDRYGKAVEQLGSAQAPVRLGGLHALEQLAQGNPDPDFRQTIVDVICAYLRMPYIPPPDETGQAEPTEPTDPAEPRVVDGGVPVDRDLHEEHQVRLTAQRILSTHLRYQDPPAGRWRKQRTADPNGRHWAGIRLDLTGAALVDFDLSGCRVGDATFGRSAFTGTTRFGGMVFTGSADFRKATFTGRTSFDAATFSSDAEFGGVVFTGSAVFYKATFTGTAWFGGATFSGDAGFGKATFSRTAWFNKATFTGTAWFSGAVVCDHANFDKAAFSGPANFRDANFTDTAYFRDVAFAADAEFTTATFTSGVWFDRATFSSDAGFIGATFSDVAGFSKAGFSGAVWFGDATFSGDALFARTTGLERAVLYDARVAPPPAGVWRVWPPTWRVETDADGWQTLRLAGPEEDGGEGNAAADPGPAGEGTGFTL